MSEENKAIARRFFEQVWNEKNLSAIDELAAANYEDHNQPPGMPSGIDGLKQTIAMYQGAFPDVRMTAEDEFAVGDKVVIRWTGRGSHTGDLMGIPPTGKQVTVTGIDVYRVSGGKLVERWGEFDQMGMMQQIGVVPAPG
jgi:predicted ester cyclase